MDLAGGWGSNGPFAFSIWIQQTNNPGELFQYVVSTRSNATGYLINTTTDVYQPNQVPDSLPPPPTPTPPPPSPLLHHPTHSATLSSNLFT